MRKSFTIITHHLFILFFLNYHTLSAQIVSTLDIYEIEQKQYNVEYGLGKAVLKMDYAQHKIDNPEVWKNVGENVDVRQVDLVFTKYPKHKQDWITDYDYLLNERVKNIMQLIPFLKGNDKVKWNIILQNKCVKEPEAKAMFHGAVVHYTAEETTEPFASVDTMKIENELDRLTTSPILQKEKYPEKESEPSDGERYRYIGVYDVYQILQGKLPIKDSLIFHIFDRNPDWDNMLIVSDWTASMYVYGVQAVMWQRQHLDTNKIGRYVFFNDGNNKKNDKKEPGKTGGIYSVKAENTDRVFKTMWKVMDRGQGGDREENDIEALRYAIRKYQDADEIILIADNKSEVRDLALLNTIDKPIRIIVCGTTEKSSIREDYIKLALQTKGSLHTLTTDYTNLHKLSEGETLFIENVQYKLIDYQLKMITDMLD